MRTVERATTTASGRIKHAEKITVYLTTDELARIEQTLLAVRHRHGIKVDRGRLIREAVGLVLDDYVNTGRSRVPRLVERLRGIR